ncbi:hypothetical protein H6F61_14785 [Cyanobacteria bacterium FACHB-472]|nr:hypothetical protein [Cyanobacteria bacterium FACHB-472]
MVRIFLTVILVGLLTACGVAAPLLNSQLIEKAIAFQVSQTQKQLSQQLNQQTPSVQISQLRIKKQESLIVNKLPTYHLQGTYNLNLEFPSRQVTQKQNPFDVYLQSQIEGKTWRLLIPESTTKDKDTKPIWRSYLIPPLY